jgi:hypothetical protein
LDLSNFESLTTKKLMPKSCAFQKPSHSCSRDLYTQETFVCQKPDSSKTFSLENPKSFEKLEEA